MEKIDWSKAPEGASHFCNGDWFKKEDGKWGYWFDGARSWPEAAYADPANFSWWGLRIERPSPAWSGVGIPAAGSICEVRQKTPCESSFDWEECRIAMINTGADGLPQVCTIDKRGDLAIYYPATDVVEFRPIRTPEQIAADEREADIKRACSVIDSHPSYHDYNRNIDCSAALRFAVEALHDAGLRFTEQSK